jgi:hypothetical protein
MNSPLVDDLRRMIERKEFELAALKTSLEIIENEPERSISAFRNGNGTSSTDAAERSPVKSEGTLRKRTISYLEGRGPQASVSTQEMISSLEVENVNSFKSNLRVMAKEGRIERLPMPDTWRCK